MDYKKREKKRLVEIKRALFSSKAVQPGTYNGSHYDLCLADDYSGENIYHEFRDNAIAYFRERIIEWHDGKEKRTRPSNHLCCSQSACVNVMYPCIHDPEYVRRILGRLGYDVAEV